MLRPNAVADATNNQVAVLNKIAEAYGVKFYPEGPNDFYNLTLAGFNYIDEACDVYIDELFKMDRRKNRLRDILTLATSTSTAVLTAADAGKEALLYVTQALGFTSGVIGITADSYLYRVGPTRVQQIVKALQAKYREEFAARYQGGVKPMSSPVAVFELRSYLTLCFPVTIEAKIDQLLAESKVVNTDKKAKVTTSLALTSTPAQ